MSVKKFEIGVKVVGKTTGRIYTPYEIFEAGLACNARDFSGAIWPLAHGDNYFLFEEEEEPIGKKLFGHKMRVTPETSRLVQEAVFEAGGNWYGDVIPCVQFLKSECLYISKDGEITYSDVDDDFFKKKNFARNSSIC